MEEYKYYLIYACEGKYEGLHGMFEVNVIRASEESLANYCGADMSYDVMERYGTLNDQYDESWSYKDIRDLYQDNLSYNIYELDCSKIGNISIEDLREEANDDWKSFVEKYGIKGELV